MYYIYHIPGVKIGCTINPKRRIENHQKCKNYEILEEHIDEKEAATRELELQRQYGYKVDSKEYNLNRFRFLQKRGLKVTQKKYTKEDFGNWGKLAGLINVKSGHIQKLGKEQGSKNVESGHLNEIRKLVDMDLARKKAGETNVKSGHIQKLGKIQGKINVENKFWEKVTFEQRSKGGKVAGKVSGKKAVESGRIKLMTEQAAEKNRKKVIATNLDTLEIFTFKSAKFASESLNVSEYCIRNVCRGKFKKAKNYKFEYEKN